MNLPTNCAAFSILFVCLLFWCSPTEQMMGQENENDNNGWKAAVQRKATAALDWASKNKAELAGGLALLSLGGSIASAVYASRQKSNNSRQESQPQQQQHLTQRLLSSQGYPISHGNGGYDYYAPVSQHRMLADMSRNAQGVPCVDIFEPRPCTFPCEWREGPENDACFSHDAPWLSCQESHSRCIKYHPHDHGKCEKVCKDRKDCEFFRRTVYGNGSCTPKPHSMNAAQTESHQGTETQRLLSESHLFGGGYNVGNTHRMLADMSRNAQGVPCIDIFEPRPCTFPCEWREGPDNDACFPHDAPWLSCSESGDRCRRAHPHELAKCEKVCRDRKDCEFIRTNFGGGKCVAKP